MTKQVIFRSPRLNRTQPLLTHRPTNTQPPEKARIGEVAGGTAAECAAICCCCPCSVMNLLVLAVYKIPAALCKKVWRKRKRRRTMKKKKQNGLMQRPIGPNTNERKEEDDDVDGEDEEKYSDEEAEAVDLEGEIWDRFKGAGFWRSSSQRDT